MPSLCYAVWIPPLQVPKDPKTYGATDSSPLFDSGEVGW